MIKESANAAVESMFFKTVTGIPLIGAFIAGLAFAFKKLWNVTNEVSALREEVKGNSKLVEEARQDIKNLTNYLIKGK